MAFLLRLARTCVLGIFMLMTGRAAKRASQCGDLKKGALQRDLLKKQQRLLKA
jgi:hypothetical protein